MKEPLLYRTLRPLIKSFVKLTYRPKFIGLENIPSNGSVVLAGNHTNILDCILLIASTKRCIHFLAKDELIKGAKKVIFKNMGIIPVNRSIHDKDALEKAKERLYSGGVIGIFPEGTINRTKDVIMPFKIGAVKMASDTSSMIVPFTIKGKYKIFKNDLVIEFQKPYKTKDTNLDHENDKLMNIIKEKLEEKL